MMYDFTRKSHYMLFLTHRRDMYVCMYVVRVGFLFFFANFNLLSVVLSRQIWYFWKGLDAISLF